MYNLKSIINSIDCMVNKCSISTQKNCGRLEVDLYFMCNKDLKLEVGNKFEFKVFTTAPYYLEGNAILEYISYLNNAQNLFSYNAAVLDSTIKQESNTIPEYKKLWVKY